MRAARETGRSCADFAPDVAVADILTPAPRWPPSWRACRSRRWCPTSIRTWPPGFPIYSIGARLPRTAARARAVARGNRRFVEPSLEQGREQYNETRRRLGLPPLP